jgi:hypothetical protein
MFLIARRIDWNGLAIAGNGEPTNITPVVYLAGSSILAGTEHHHSPFGVQAFRFHAIVSLCPPFFA